MKHSLVVEDSPVIRAVACRILEHLNFVTHEADVSEAGLTACQSTMPDLILLDGNMPDMKGTDFLRAVRREKNGRSPVIVFCTTENDTQQIAEAIIAGASDVVMKPFDRASIAAKLAGFGLA